MDYDENLFVVWMGEEFNSIGPIQMHVKSFSSMQGIQIVALGILRRSSAVEDGERIRTRLLLLLKKV